MSDRNHDDQDDTLGRRGFLQCMAWAGTGVLWTLGGGLASSTLVTAADAAARGAAFPHVRPDQR